MRQLVKMIQQRDEIHFGEGGTLIIPSPSELEKILPEYYRTAKLASFQRQLNNARGRVLEKNARGRERLSVLLRAPRARLTVPSPSAVWLPPVEHPAEPGGRLSLVDEYDDAYRSNWIPCASGSSSLQLMVLVWRRM